MGARYMEGFECYNVSGPTLGPEQSPPKQSIRVVGEDPWLYQMPSNSPHYVPSCRFSGLTWHVVGSLDRGHAGGTGVREIWICTLCLRSDDYLGNQKEWSWNQEYRTTLGHANFCVDKLISHKQLEKTHPSESRHPHAQSILTMIVYSLQVHAASPSRYQPCTADQSLFRSSEKPVPASCNRCHVSLPPCLVQVLFSSLKYIVCMPSSSPPSTPRSVLGDARDQTFSRKMLLLSLALSSRRSPSMGLGETPLKLMLEGSAASSSKGFRPSLLSVLPLSSPNPRGGCCGVAARFIE